MAGREPERAAADLDYRIQEENWERAYEIECFKEMLGRFGLSLEDLALNSPPSPGYQGVFKGSGLDHQPPRRPGEAYLPEEEAAPQGDTATNGYFQEDLGENGANTCFH